MTTLRAEQLMQAARVDNLRYEAHSEIANYNILGGLDKTKTAEVYCAENDKTGQLVALKLPLDDADPVRLRTEIQLHSRVADHPNVVTIDGFGGLDEGERPYFATRLQENGTLARYVNGFNTPKDCGVNGVLRLLRTSADEEPTGGWIENIEVDMNLLKADEHILGLLPDLSRVAKTGSSGEAGRVLDIVTSAAAGLGVDIEPDSLTAHQLAIHVLNKSPEARAVKPPTAEELKTCFNILHGIASGVEGVHRRGIVALRDLKFNNVCLNSNMWARIIDFGLATTATQVELIDKIPGTIANVPAEAYRGEVSNAFDWFCVSKMGYRLLGGIDPWELKLDEARNLRLMETETPRHLADLNPDLSEEVAEVYMQGLAFAPEDRSSMVDHMRVLAPLAA